MSSLHSAIAAIGLAVQLLAQTAAPRPQPATSELEDWLFVLRPQGARVKEAVHVLWIPQPLQKYCLGRTAEQCSTIDYCIRTTNRGTSRCMNLGVDVSRLPPYPSGIRPRRLLSVIYFPAAPIPGFESLLNYCRRAPPDQLERLTNTARIKARIKLTRSDDDDQFDLLEVLAVPPVP